MSKELENKLKELDIEDFIWVIYIGIIFMSWYSNSLERKYFTQKDELAKRKYREIMICIFIILLIVYLYFLYSAYQDFKELKPNDSDKKKRLVFLSLLGSLFIVISGIIFLYIAFNDDELNVELAFN